jgi:hypothetical protein
LKLVSDVLVAVVKIGAYPEQRSGLGEEVVALVQGAPPERQLGRVPLPGLQVRRHPDDVEDREEDIADVLEGLVFAVATELRF